MLKLIMARFNYRAIFRMQAAEQHIDRIIKTQGGRI